MKSDVSRQYPATCYTAYTDPMQVLLVLQQVFITVEIMKSANEWQQDHIPAIYNPAAYRLLQNKKLKAYMWIRPVLMPSHVALVHSVLKSHKIKMVLVST